LDLPGVAQAQNSKCGKSLCHRGDAKQRIRSHRALGFQILDPEAPNVHEPAIRDDSIDEAGMCESRAKSAKIASTAANISESLVCEGGGTSVASALGA